MASRTQLRLGQITGSFGAGGSIDTSGIESNTTATGSLAISDVGGALSYIANAVRKIHGATDFNQAQVGEFHTNIFPSSQGGPDIGAVGTEWGDIYIADKTISIGVGQEHTIADGNTGLLIDSSEAIEINSSAAPISIGNDAVAQAINIGTGAAARTITVGNTTGATTLDINLGTGGLDVDATNGPIELDTTNTGTGITIGTANANVPISIGNATSEVTINDNLTVAGDLTVNGDTVTLDVTNKSIEDQLIILNSGSAANPTKQDVGIVFAQPDLSRVLFIDDSDSSKFVFATTYTSGTAAGTNAVTKVGDADVRLGALNATNITNAGLTEGRVTFAGANGLLSDDQHFTYSGTNDILTVRNMQFSGSDARIEFRDENNSIDVTSGGVMTLNANDDIILDADGDDIHLKYGTNTVGFLKNSSDNLILSGGHAGKDLALAANSGVVQFIDPADGTSVGAIIDSKLLESSLTLSASSGNNLILGSNDTYIQFDVAEEDIFLIKSAGGEAILSSSVDRQISLYPNDGKVTIYQNNTAGGAALGLFIDAGKDVVGLSSAFVGVDGFKNLEIGGSPGAEKLIVSGTHLALSGGVAPQELRFFEPTSAGENYVALEAPDTIGSNFTISLPNAIGTAGQVLKIASVGSGDAQLEFGAAAAGVEKTQMAIISGLISGSALDPNSVTVSNTLPFTRGALDLSGVGGSDLDNLVDVFVNGQLLVSGSDANVGAGTADYLISTHSSTSQLKFGFDLEVDDTVIINKKG